MLENNPARLDRAEIERVVENQYNRLLRQHDSKALSASGNTTTLDRGEKNREPPNRFEVNHFNCRRKGHRAEECRSAKKKIEKSGDAPTDKKSGDRESATSVRVKSTLRINAVACAEVWSTGLVTVRSEELRRVRCWPKQMCQRMLRWDW